MAPFPGKYIYGYIRSLGFGTRRTRGGGSTADRWPSETALEPLNIGGTGGPRARVAGSVELTTEGLIRIYGSMDRLRVFETLIPELQSTMVR